MSRAFFNESREQSEVKTAIVTKYFDAWAKVIKRHARADKLGYIDLFAGPGRYIDGTKSTPIVLLEKAIADPDLRRMLVTVFNDADEDHSRTLEKEIRSLKGIDSLRFPPDVWNSEVGSEIATLFEGMNLIPTLSFVDPWGYKGLSLRLVNSFVKDWACECVFFFNYNRINMGLGNPVVAEHVDALFGPSRGAELRGRLDGLAPEERELEIVEELAAALSDYGGEFVLPFRFRRGDGQRTSHHLIFVSKHIRGYSIMKDVMARESSSHTHGVPSFEYSPGFRNQGLLFELSRPLDDLEDMLLRSFAGARLTVLQIFDRHHVGTPFVLKNYKDVLHKLHSEGRIGASRSEKGDKWRKNSFPDDLLVEFPRALGHGSIAN